MYHYISSKQSAYLVFVQMFNGVAKSEKIRNARSQLLMSLLLVTQTTLVGFGDVGQCKNRFGCQSLLEQTTKKMFTINGPFLRTVTKGYEVPQYSWPWFICVLSYLVLFHHKIALQGLIPQLHNTSKIKKNLLMVNKQTKLIFKGPVQKCLM